LLRVGRNVLHLTVTTSKNIYMILKLKNCSFIYFSFYTSIRTLLFVLLPSGKSRTSTKRTFRTRQRTRRRRLYRTPPARSAVRVRRVRWTTRAGVRVDKYFVNGQDSHQERMERPRNRRADRGGFQTRSHVRARYRSWSPGP